MAEKEDLERLALFAAEHAPKLVAAVNTVVKEMGFDELSPREGIIVSALTTQVIALAVGFREMGRS